LIKFRERGSKKNRDNTDKEIEAQRETQRERERERERESYGESRDAEEFSYQKEK